MPLPADQLDPKQVALRQRRARRLRRRELRKGAAGHVTRRWIARWA